MPIISFPLPPQAYIISLPLPPTPKNNNTTTMDFSQFNGAEQAHMSKVIEKKQVGRLPLFFHSTWA